MPTPHLPYLLAATTLQHLLCVPVIHFLSINLSVPLAQPPCYSGIITSTARSVFSPESLMSLLMTPNACGTSTILYYPPLKHTLPPEQILADISFSEHNIALSNYNASRQEMAHGVSAYHVRADKNAWGKWTKFTTQLGIHFDLSDAHDMVPILQIFAQRVRSGILIASVHQIWKRSINKYLHLLGQIFVSVGYLNSQMDSMGNVTFWIQHQIFKYQNVDPPPHVSAFYHSPS